jgi:hypothetical protein
VERRFYWLSFVDARRRRGDRFLGACVVEVTSADALLTLAKFPTMHDKENGPWVAGAAAVAWREGCNPGGEVGAAELPPEAAALYPRNTLMTKAQIAAIESRSRAH